MLRRRAQLLDRIVLRRAHQLLDPRPPQPATVCDGPVTGAPRRDGERGPRGSRATVGMSAESPPSPRRGEPAQDSPAQREVHCRTSQGRRCDSRGRGGRRGRQRQAAPGEHGRSRRGRGAASARGTPTAWRSRYLPALSVLRSLARLCTAALFSQSNFILVTGSLRRSPASTESLMCW